MSVVVNCFEIQMIWLSTGFWDTNDLVDLRFK